MKINRFNYEEFFILYIDNELNAEERAEVDAFVSEHADLAAELDMLKDAVIKPETNVVFSAKETLLRQGAETSRIHKDSCQPFFILYADDELTPDERKDVEAFIYHHPEFQAELEAFEQAKLAPETVIYPHKEKLYRNERKPVVMNWWKYAAAAAILLVAGSLWLNNQPAENEDNNNLAEAVKTRIKPDPHVTRQAPATTPVAESHPQVKIAEDNSVNVANPQVSTSKGRQEKITPKAFTEQQPGATREIASDAPAKRLEKHQIDFPEPKIALTNDSELALAANTTPDQSTIAAETVQVTQAVYSAEEPEMTDERTSSVYIANISVDNPSIKPLLRKASRFINRVASIRSGDGRILSTKKVEIAIQ